MRIRLLSASDSRPAEQVDAEVAVGVGDGVRRLGRPAAGEHAEPRGTGGAPSSWQQVVAPGDRAAQRPLPLRHVARARRRGRGCDRAARGSAPGSAAGSGPPRARWPAAGRRAARRSPGSRPASRRRATGPGRCARARSIEEGDAGIDVERRDRVAALAGDPQQLAAGDEQPQRRAPPGRAPATMSAPRREQLLEVVEDEQHRSDRGGARGGPRATVRSGDSRMPSVAAMAGSRSAASRSAARSTNHDAMREPVRERARATASASRVLPLPPGPVRVTIRLSASASRTRRDLGVSPTSGVTSPGRFEGGSIVRSGRASSAAPGTTRRWSGVGSSKSLTARRPVVDQLARRQAGRARQRSGARHERVRQDDLAAVPRRGDPRGVVHVDPDVVLGVAGAAAVAQPALAEVEAHPDPERRARPASGSAAIARWAATAAAVASTGRSKAAKNASPSVLTTTPRCASIASRRSRRGGATSARPGRRSDGALEPCRALDVGEQERDGWPVGSPIAGAHHRRRA